MSLEIVIGPMFSGKSSYALSYIRRQTAIGKKVIAIKPSIDNRYSMQEEIVTHNQDRTPCIMWDRETHITPTQEMLNADCLVVEEAQFFQGLFSWCDYMMRVHHKDIVLVGLDGDANRAPFKEILYCIPLSSKITKLTALCSKCRNGTEAPFTRRKSIANDNGRQIDVGGAEKYESVCIQHL